MSSKQIERIRGRNRGEEPQGEGEGKERERKKLIYFKELDHLIVEAGSQSEMCTAAVQQTRNSGKS